MKISKNNMKNIKNHLSRRKIQLKNILIFQINIILMTKKKKYYYIFQILKGALIWENTKRNTLIDKDNQKTALLLYNQLIELNKNDNNKLIIMFYTIKYFLFPKLLYDNIFLKMIIIANFIVII